VIHDSGVRFSPPDPASYPLAPSCIIRQQRSHPHYRVRLPRLHSRYAAIGFVQITLAGRGRVELADGSSQDVPVGSCLLTCMSDRLCYAAAEEGWEFVYMTFCGRSTRSLIEDLVAMHGHVVRADPQHRLIRQMCAYTETDTVQSSQIDPGLAARLAGDVLLQLIEWNALRDDPENRLLAQATALLADNLAEPPSVDAVARACGISREHLTRLFTARIGCPPARWLRDERLRHAELLLHDGIRPVSEIATLVGYHSASAFVAAFRSAYGHTPAVYRSL